MPRETEQGSGTHFLRPGEAIWRCGNCGRVMVQGEEPSFCPVCREKEHFHLVKPENY